MISLRALASPLRGAWRLTEDVSTGPRFYLALAPCLRTKTSRLSVSEVLSWRFSVPSHRHFSLERPSTGVALAAIDQPLTFSACHYTHHSGFLASQSPKAAALRCNIHTLLSRLVHLTNQTIHIPATQRLTLKPGRLITIHVPETLTHRHITAIHRGLATTCCYVSLHEWVLLGSVLRNRIAECTVGVRPWQSSAHTRKMLEASGSGKGSVL
jgi:hypothetical protein